MLTPAKSLAILTFAVLSGTLYPARAATIEWYDNDPLAQRLSQLTPAEVEKFRATDLMEVRPVVLPRSKYVITENDYFDWPIGTMIGRRLIVLYDRRHFHFGGAGNNTDENSGIRMVVYSDDGGKTWSEPYDMFQLPAWSNSPFKGWGGGFGVSAGIVYLALDRGVYKSADQGGTWTLVSERPTFAGIPGPLWSAGMRLTSDRAHGLTIWTNRGFKDKRKDNPDYGRYLGAVSTKDGGQSWSYQEQELPGNVRLSEITPVQYGTELAFFLRNGIHDIAFAEGYSATGWFPFEFHLTNVATTGTTDTPDVAFNPVTNRLEATVTLRNGEGAGPGGGNKLNLYSLEPQELAKGKSEWRYDGTLVRYRGTFHDKSDGMNPVGTIMDPVSGKQYIYVWAGDQVGQAGVFQYTRSLDTPKVTRYLHDFYEHSSTEKR